MAKKKPDWVGGAKAAYRVYEAHQQLSAFGQGWAKLKADSYEFGVCLLAAGIVILIALL